MADENKISDEQIEEKKVTIEDLVKAMEQEKQSKTRGSDLKKAAMFKRTPFGLSEIFDTKIKGKKSKRIDLDEGDGAMFSRISSDLSRATHGADTDIKVSDEPDKAMFSRIKTAPSELQTFDTNAEIANEATIVPQTNRYLNSEPPVPFYSNPGDLVKAEPVDDIDTSERFRVIVDDKGDSDRPEKADESSGQRISSNGEICVKDEIESIIKITSEHLAPPAAIGKRTTVEPMENDLQSSSTLSNDTNSVCASTGANRQLDETEHFVDHETEINEPEIVLQMAIGVRKSISHKDDVESNKSSQKTSRNNSRKSLNDTQEALIGPTPEQKEFERASHSGVSEFKPKYLISLILPSFSVLLFLADIGTDIELAVSYKRKGAIDLFYITLACIIVSSIIMAAIDLSWLWIDMTKPTKNKRTTPTENKSYMIARIVLGVLSFGRIVRAIQYMYHIIKKEIGPDKKWHRDRAIEHKRDCYMMDFINAFVESCPQLFVQMFLLYKYDLPIEFVRVLSLLTSWISIAWTYASYYRSHREALSGRQDVKFFGFLLFFWSVLSTLAARVICVTLFLVYFKPWIGALVLLIHFIAMVVWIKLQSPSLEGTTNTKFGHFMYALLFAYVSMMCFVNLKDTRARIRMVMFYLSIYVENCVISGLVIWRMLAVEKNSQKTMNFIVLPVGFAFHLTFLLLYYRCLHPKRASIRSNNRAV